MDELARVHSPTYLAELEAFCARGRWQHRPRHLRRGSTRGRRPVGPRARGWRARRARAARRRGVAFVPVRPPGHHATATTRHGVLPAQQRRRRGSVAHGARRARPRSSIGTCTTATARRTIFWDDPDVLYVSTHQHPLYPGTGSPARSAVCGAPGLTVNLPLPPGATGDVVRAALDRRGARRHRGLRARLGAGVVWLRRPPGRPAEQPRALER